ncbi:MAG: hypothetical protein GY828_01345 [Candidatus Gracilibacteria bacterium]|nr:hypothetical protein [Candidatus Gracilibacteria bacterium]
MFTLTSSLTGIKKSQFVYFVEDKSDLEYLDFLDLDKKIIKKIESSLKKDTSEKLTFFLGNPDFENLHVFVYNAHKDQSFIDFVSKKIKTIGNDFTFSSQNRKKISDLLKSVVLSTYKFDQYKSEKKETNIYFYTDEKYISELEDTYQLTQNIILARELGETPSSDLTPEIFAKLVKKTKFKNIKVKILTPKQVEKKGLGLLWGVGKASVNKPYVVILEKVVDKKAPTIGIVGKGVTFDTGGIQVKPGDHMYEMKGDMCGAATVFATMKELDEKDISVNIVAALGLAENSISGEGYKPSDILTAYNGKTVDIIHTDAEGRLVMADVMSYISDKYKLDSLMTVATLTGACMVALGYRYAGIMGNDEKVITSLLE